MQRRPAVHVALHRHAPAVRQRIMSLDCVPDQIAQAQPTPFPEFGGIHARHRQRLTDDALHPLHGAQGARQHRVPVRIVAQVHHHALDLRVQHGDRGLQLMRGSHEEIATFALHRTHHPRLTGQLVIGGREPPVEFGQPTVGLLHRADDQSAAQPRHHRGQRHDDADHRQQQSNERILDGGALGIDRDGHRGPGAGRVAARFGERPCREAIPLHDVGRTRLARGHHGIEAVRERP